MNRLVAGIVGSLLLAGTADASVLCAKPRKSGALEGSVKIRTACRPGEVQLAPEDVGFCCTLPPPSSSTTTSSVTTSSTTTGSCPTYTSTTLGVPDCGGSGACFGLCPNAHACEPDATTGACGCTGPLQPCGITSYNGICGGSCPAGQTCQYYGPPGPDGCPGEPHCVCVP